MHRLEKILITTEELNVGIKKAANWLNNEYSKISGKEPIILIGILKGCIPFLGKLFDQLTFDTKLDFMCLASYDGGTANTNNLKIITDLKQDISNYHVIIIEDIIDSGATIKKIKEILTVHNPASIKVVTLLNKDVPKEEIVDYYCFQVPNKFLVGFGLDYNEILRNIPCVGILKPEYY